MVLKAEDILGRNADSWRDADNSAWGNATEGTSFSSSAKEVANNSLVKTAKVKLVPREYIHFKDEFSAEKIIERLRAEGVSPKVIIDNSELGFHIQASKWGNPTNFVQGTYAVSVKGENDFWAIDPGVFAESYTVDSDTECHKNILNVKYLHIQSLDLDTATAAYNFMGLSDDPLNAVLEGVIKVKSLEGDQDAVEGTVILQGVKGEFWVSQYDKFLGVYDI